MYISQADIPTMKRIYIFSGLGADERVFKYLNFPGYEPIFIRWLQPIKGESIEHYSKRLTEQITTSKPILIGLSFGGIIATEVSKVIDTEKIILMASAKTKKEIPYYYRWPGFLNLHKLLPTFLMKKPGVVSNWFFGIQSKEEKKLLSDIMSDTDPKFLKWAINQIVKWRNLTKAENIKHIHGTSDRILPYRFVHADFTIHNGGHFMTVNKSAELNKVLEGLL